MGRVDDCIHLVLSIEILHKGTHRPLHLFLPFKQPFKMTKKTVAQKQALNPKEEENTRYPHANKMYKSQVQLRMQTQRCIFSLEMNIHMCAANQTRST